MAKEYRTSINLNQNEIVQGAFEKLSSAPSTPISGQFYYNTTSNKFFGYNGTDWVDLSVFLSQETLYTPSTPSNWVTTPSEVKGALDQLDLRSYNLGLIINNADANSADDNTTVTTSSATFTDIPGMTLNTDTVIARRYLVNFSIQVSVAPSNKIVTLRLLQDGIVIPGSVRSSQITSSGAQTVLSVVALTSLLTNAKTIKAQWNINSGTATSIARTLTILNTNKIV